MTVAQSRELTLDFIFERMADENLGSMQIRSRFASKRSKTYKVEPLLDAAPDWKWENLELEIDPTGRLSAKYSRQRNAFQLPKSITTRVSRPTEILVKMAVKKKWRNPPVLTKQRSADSRAFERLRILLQDLFQIRGDPFDKVGKDFVPRFMLRLSKETQEAAAHRNEKELSWEDEEF
jgi:hypothetical protein